MFSVEHIAKYRKLYVFNEICSEMFTIMCCNEICSENNNNYLFLIKSCSKHFETNVFE